MKKLLLLFIATLCVSFGYSQTYKVRKTYSANYNKLTDDYDYNTTTYPEGMYITVNGGKISINDKVHSVYTMGEKLKDKDDDCASSTAEDNDGIMVGIRACKTESATTLTILYVERYFIIYYLD